jgi:F-type H+-transporting ATPase subunit c
MGTRKKVLWAVAALLCLSGVALAAAGEGDQAQTQPAQAAESQAAPAQQQQPGERAWEVVALPKIAGALGAAMAVIGGGFSISRIAERAVESIARQPEAAGQMSMAWLLPAAMIEGAMLFAIVVSLLVAIG